MAIIKKVPSNLDPTLKAFLDDMRSVLIGLHTSSEPLRPPTNVQVTAIGGGARIRFTPSNGQSYTLFIGTSPDMSKAASIVLGGNVDYVDNVGKGGIGRWYWVIATAPGKMDSGPTGVVSTTTLEPGAAVTAVKNPPPARGEFVNPNEKLSGMRTPPSEVVGGR